MCGERLLAAMHHGGGGGYTLVVDECHIPHTHTHTYTHSINNINVKCFGCLETHYIYKSSQFFIVIIKNPILILSLAVARGFGGMVFTS